MNSPSRQVAVVRLSCAGDVLLTLPAVAALKAAWPDRRVVCLTRPAYLPLLQGQPGVDAVVAVPPGRSMWRLQAALWALQGAQTAPLAVLDLHGRPYARLLRWLWWRSPWVSYTRRSWRRSAAFLLGDGRALAPQHIVGRYHRAVEGLVGRPVPRQPLRFVVPEAAAAAAAALLPAAQPGAPWVALSPGAMWATKRWPVARFAALAAACAARGWRPVLTGSAAEAPLHEAVRRVAPQALCLAGRGDLATLGGILARCACLVVGDSGPMHLARAVGTPVVALFGCTDPRQFDFAGHTMLQAATDCAPCTFHGRRACPRGHFRCLLDISLEQVVAAVQAQLAAASRPPPVFG